MTNVPVQEHPNDQLLETHFETCQASRDRQCEKDRQGRA